MAVNGGRRNPKEEVTRLYETEGKRIYHFIYKMTGDRHISEDLLQDTFICAWQRIETYRGESSLSTWIFSIAKNYCLQHLQKTKGTSFWDMENLIALASKEEDESLYSDTEKNIYVRQIKEGCLLGLLRCLPLYQRLAFILKVLYDIPLEDCAEIIGKTRNATRILVHRSRRKIKDFLCRNCSLYRGGEGCRCENLISFSLEKQWICKGDSPILAGEIESDLRDFKDEISLYKSLHEQNIANPVSKRIAQYIQASKAEIFSKKVK